MFIYMKSLKGHLFQAQKDISRFFDQREEG